MNDFNTIDPLNLSGRECEIITCPTNNNGGCIPERIYALSDRETLHPRSCFHRKFKLKMLSEGDGEK